MTRIFLFLIGFGISIIGFMNLILYLNLFTMGYEFIEYIFFVGKRFECWLCLIGIFIITITIFYER